MKLKIYHFKKPISIEKEQDYENIRTSDDMFGNRAYQ